MASSSGSGGQWGGQWGWWKSGGWKDDDGAASEAPDWGGSEKAADEDPAPWLGKKEKQDEEPAEQGAETESVAPGERKRRVRGGLGRPSRMRWIAKEAGAPIPRKGKAGEGHLPFAERSDQWKVRYLVEKAMHTQMADINKLQDMLFKAETLDGWKWCRRLSVTFALRVKLRAPSF
jgi:hypothetical protein